MMPGTPRAQRVSHRRRSILVALGLIGAGALAGFLATAVVARRLYVESATARLDPLGLSRWGAAPETGDRHRVVILGDSRAAHWPVPDDGSMAVLNRGISGQTTHQVLGRFDAHVAALAPDVVVIQVGVNDLKCIPLLPDRADQIEAECLENIRRIVERARGAGATVIVTTIFPHARIPLHRRPFFDSRVTRAIERVNEAIRSMATSDIVVLDSAILLAGSDGLIRPEFSRDLLHVSPAGYAVLNEKLITEIGSILSPSSRSQSGMVPAPAGGSALQH